jgi:hypothetical protein
VPQAGRRGWEEILEQERVLAAGQAYGLPRDAEAEQEGPLSQRFSQSPWPP